MSQSRPIIHFLAACLMVNAGIARADFVLRDGDTVAFLGDSITAARGYTKIVEHYTLMRFPDRAVRFINAGEGGDTASGCLARLEHDVFERGATVVTVAFGINDIGWGTKADDAHRQKFLDGIREIITRCDQRGVRAIICSPAITAEPSAKAETGYLQAMADDGLALAKSLGARTIDIQREMRAVQRRVEETNAAEEDAANQTRLHLPDGVHLNELGQLAMAFAMLRGLGAPSEVSTVAIDAGTAQVTAVEGATVTDLVAVGGGIAFRRLDAGWPLTLAPLSALQFRWVPVHEHLNGYRLAVAGLAAGDYELVAGGRSLGTVDAAQLAAGLNLTTMTADPWHPGGPWNVQSDTVKDLVEARDFLAAAGRQRERYAGSHPADAARAQQLEETDAELVALQRSVAKPYAYLMEIRPLPEGEPASQEE